MDRPVLDRSPDYEFVGLDIDERPGCARLYDRFIVQSIETPLPEKADVIISFTLLEHVPNNTASIRAMYDGLNGGGARITMSRAECIPTLWHFAPLGQGFSDASSQSSDREPKKSPATLPFSTSAHPAL
ncbi:class I SAM-dependent methyltransferase [Roseovarius sp.]|uniref:class I SAM-dependent methyltransferase n=1 Tax=Roseovarius sp. TaxID=1486281 RepID=UPI003563CB24